MSAGLLMGALKVTLAVAAPFLLLLLLVGLVTAVLQAGTGVQDQSSAQAVKLGALGVSLVVAGPWALRFLAGFTRGLWLDLGRFLH